MADANDTPNVIDFRDDDAQGFALRVYRAADGDFHISIVPRAEDFEFPEDAHPYAACFGASVRVRVPMIGGGSHPHLYAALVDIWRARGMLPPAIVTTTKKRRRKQYRSALREPADLKPCPKCGQYPVELIALRAAPPSPDTEPEPADVIEWVGQCQRCDFIATALGDNGVSAGHAWNALPRGKNA